MCVEQNIRLELQCYAEPGLEGKDNDDDDDRRDRSSQTVYRQIGSHKLMMMMMVNTLVSISCRFD